MTYENPFRYGIHLKGPLYISERAWLFQLWKIRVYDVSQPIKIKEKRPVKVLPEMEDLKQLLDIKHHLNVFRFQKSYKRSSVYKINSAEDQSMTIKKWKACKWSVIYRITDKGLLDH